VPQHEAVAHQVSLDRRKRADDARFGGRQEADRGQQQHAGIEHVRAVGFDKAVLRGGRSPARRRRVNATRASRAIRGGALKPNFSALLMARSNATQVITLDET